MSGTTTTFHVSVENDTPTDAPRPAGQASTLRNLRVLVAIVDEAAAVQISTIVEQMGGKVVQEVEIDALPNVLVADSTQHILYKALTDIAPAVPIVSPIWVQESLRLNRKASFDKFKLGCFTGCKICATGYSLPDREILGQKVRENGGEYSADLQRPPHCTHLVAKQSKQPSKKLEFAFAWKIEVVSEQWLADCIDLGRCLDPSRYQVDTRGIPVLGFVEAATIRVTSNGPTAAVAIDQADAHPPSPKRARLAAPNTTLKAASKPLSHTLPMPTCDAPTQPVVRPALGTSTMLTGCHWGCSRPHLYLEAVQLYALGCDEAVTAKICKNVMEGGATRLPTLLPQVTHVLVGPGVTSEECQAVREHVSAYKHVQLVRPRWLDDCVEAMTYVQPGHHLLTPTTMLAVVQRPQGSKQDPSKAAHAAPGLDDPSLAGEDVASECVGRMSGMWFTLVAVQGTHVEQKAREIILRAGGKLFDAQSTVLVDRAQAYAVCPMGMSTATVAETTTKYPDFQMVDTRHRVTLYWLMDYLKFGFEQLGSLEHHPVKQDVPLNDFRKVVVHTTGLEPDIKDKIKILVEEVAGGRFLDKVETKQLAYLTHVIATADALNPKKLSAFIKHQKPIVEVKWLTQSIRAGRRLQEQPFIISFDGVEGLSQMAGTTQLPPTQAPRRSTRLSPPPDKKRPRDPTKTRAGSSSKLSQGTGTPGKGTQRTPKRQKAASSLPSDMGPSQRSNINLKPPKPHTGPSQRQGASLNELPVQMSQQTSSRAAAAAARLATPVSSPPKFNDTKTAPPMVEGPIHAGASATYPHTSTAAPSLSAPQAPKDNLQPAYIPHPAPSHHPATHRPNPTPSGSRHNSHSGPTAPSVPEDITPPHVEVIAQEQHQVDPVAPCDPKPIILQHVHSDRSNPPSTSHTMAPPLSNPGSLNAANPGLDHSNPPGGTHSNPPGGTHSNPASCNTSSAVAANPVVKDAAQPPTGERISLFQRVMAAHSPPGYRALLQTTSSEAARQQPVSGEAPSGPKDVPPGSSLPPTPAAAEPTDMAVPHVAPGSEHDWQAVEQMFDDLPLHKETLCETQEMFVDLLSGKGNSGQGSLPQPRRQQRGQKSQDSGGSGNAARTRKRPAPPPAGQGRMTRQRQHLLQQQQDMHMPSQFEMSQQIGYDTGPRPAERVTRGRLGNQDKKRKEEMLQKLQAVDTKTSRNPDRLQQLGLAE